MRFYLTVMTAGLFVSTLCAGALEDFAGRVSPELGGKVHFTVDPSLTTIEVGPSGTDGIRIAAPSTRLAAAGVGCYLRSVAGAHWSWCGNRLDTAMPIPTETLAFTPTLPHSLAYNYCTLSYTMAFWDETRWRAELDRLALYGFEYFLVQAGLPEVWRRTLRDLGYPENRIAAFIPDDAAAAWWNMGNLEGLGGPVPEADIQKNAALGRWIVQEARALGLKPILQGFVGLLPTDIETYLSKTDYPDARFVPQGEWVDGFMRPIVLDPTTEAYTKIADIWYRHLFEVYGVTSADAFGGDLFHEGGQIGDLNVTASATAVQQAQQKASPGAIWMIQAWHASPRAELLAGLDPRFAMVEALVADNANGDRYRRSFGEVPWLWCELLNFGGNQGLYGGLQMLSRLDNLLKSPNAKTLQGFGLLSEGLETNPVFYEYFTERFFTPVGASKNLADLKSWLATYIQRRYGQAVPELHEAFLLLADSVYNPNTAQEGCTESIYCVFPSWEARKASSWASGRVYYDTETVLKAAQLFLKAAKEHPELLDQETFRYDFADVARQVLSDLARPLLSLASSQLESRRAFVDAITLTDEVLSAVPRWDLSYKLEGMSTSEKLALIRMYTSWSGRPGALNDYAHRQYATLLRNYYLPRWEAFMGVTAALHTEGSLLHRVEQALDFASAARVRFAEGFQRSQGAHWDTHGASGHVTLRYSVADRITDAGLYTISINHGKNDSPFHLTKVQLFEGEKLVAEGTAAGEGTVSLYLAQFRTGLEDYTLVIEGFCEHPTSGTFTLDRE